MMAEKSVGKIAPVYLVPFSFLQSFSFFNVASTSLVLLSMQGGGKRGVNRVESSVHV